jgi:hypothetical protein
MKLGEGRRVRKRSADCVPSAAGGTAWERTEGGAQGAIEWPVGGRRPWERPYSAGFYPLAAKSSRGATGSTTS